ncbi:hypothetical protein BD769DRAFT_1396706 [Suillus cothurnatus]|nr:hypothetical protein BD769DRAFT_1396706 [Suillus cothurnatus]
MSTTSINSMQWLDLATNIKNITTISFTLEAQFVFQKSVSSSASRTSESTTRQTIPGDGISKPAIIITTEKSPYLQDPRRKLEDTTMFHTIELLEEIFASGLAEHVHKKAFTQDWTKLVVPAARYTQDSADNKNMFQLGSRASLPFPPPPSVAIPRGATTSHTVRSRHGNSSSVTTRHGTTTRSHHGNPPSTTSISNRNRQPAVSTHLTPQTGTLEDILQRPDFETWLLARQQDQQSTSSTMLGVRPPARQTRHTRVSPALTRRPNNSEMRRTQIRPTSTSTSISTVSSISAPARSQLSSDDSDSIADFSHNSAASCCSYSEHAPHDANRTFDGSAVVAEQRQFPGVDYTMEFSAAPHEHGIDLTRFCISASTGGSDGRPPPPPYELVTNGPVVFVQNGIVVRLGQGQANNARQC